MKLKLSAAAAGFWDPTKTAAARAIANATLDVIGEVMVNGSNQLVEDIVATLAPGTYTAVLSGKAGTSGVGLIEVYDLTAEADSRLANISTRGFVGVGDNAMIAGLIVGQESTSLVVRAIGPSLGAAGVDNALLDPQLDIYNSNGDLSWSNDSWKQQEYSFQLPELKKTGLGPTDDREAALQFGSNAPDNWTVVVRGKGGATGVALVEVYDLGR